MCFNKGRIRKTKEELRGIGKRMDKRPKLRVHLINMISCKTPYNFTATTVKNHPRNNLRPRGK